MPSSKSASRTGLPSPGTSDRPLVGDLGDPDLVLRFWKPYDCLSAFTDREGRTTLTDYVSVPNVYAAGRLDRDSEGLLLLARSKTLRGRLTDAAIGHPRTYLVQIEGVPSQQALDRLAAGLDLKDGRTRPAIAERVEGTPDLPARPVPIRVRKTVPDSWVRLTLTEGKNRQVRRMTAAVGHPTLRLVRWSIGSVTLDGLVPGEWQALNANERRDLRAGLRAPRAASRSDPPRRARAPRSQC